MARTPEEEKARAKAYWDKHPNRSKYRAPLITPKGVPLLLYLAQFGTKGTRWVPFMRSSNRMVVNAMRRRDLILIAKLPIDNVRLTSIGWELVRVIAPGLMPQAEPERKIKREAALARRERRAILRAEGNQNDNHEKPTRREAP